MSQFSDSLLNIPVEALLKPFLKKRNRDAYRPVDKRDRDIHRHRIIRAPRDNLRLLEQLRNGDDRRQ